MSDDFLSRLREEPRPEFKDRLESRLHEIDAREDERRSAPSPYRRFAPAFAGAALAAALAFAFTLEPVRAAAREFLDLFRVKRFAAVPVDPARLERLAKGGLDFKSLVADQVQVVVAPQPPEAVDSPEAGAVRAGITAQLPAVLPARTELAEAKLSLGGQLPRPGRHRQARGARARRGRRRDRDPGLLERRDDRRRGASGAGRALRAQRPTPPARAPPREDSFVLLQSAIPQVELPEGFDLATLGRLGLRLAGMSAVEALSFSRAIDWRSTLLVPVPVQGGTFREVEVSGHKGLLVTFQPPAPTDASAPRPRTQGLVLWSTDDKVLAVQGPGGREGIELLEMAQSIR